jgi:hypothetical protein
LTQLGQLHTLNSDLTSKQTGGVQVRLDLSKSRTNLGELLQEQGHVDQAIPELGSVYDGQAQLWDKTGQLEKAGQSIEPSVVHEQEAVKLTDGKVAAYRIALAGHLAILAKICLELRAYDDAIRAAVDMSKIPSVSGQRYVDAAKLLAQDMNAANEDTQPDRARRDQIGRQFPAASRCYFVRRSTPIPSLRKKSSLTLSSHLSSAGPKSGMFWATNEGYEIW